MQRRTGKLIFCVLSAVASTVLVIVFAWGTTRLAEQAALPGDRALFYVGAAVGTMAGLMFYNAILSVYNVVRLGMGSLEESRSRIVLALALCALFAAIMGGSYVFLRTDPVLSNPEAVRQQWQRKRRSPGPRRMPSGPTESKQETDEDAAESSEK